VEIEKDKMNAKQIASAYLEFKIPESEGADHWIDILEKIDKKGKLTEVSEALQDLVSKLYS
jgi:hypothetical protein